MGSSKEHQTCSTKSQYEELLQFAIEDEGKIEQINEGSIGILMFSFNFKCSSIETVSLNNSLIVDISMLINSCLPKM